MRIYLNKLTVALMVAIAVASSCPSPALGRQKLDPAEVKAGFIYHLAKLVTWPEGSFENDDAPIIIGFLGDDETADYFEENAPGFEAHGRKLVVKRFVIPSRTQDFFAREKFLDEVKGCVVIFLSADVQDEVGDYVKSLSARGLLTIGETKEFVEGEGLIGLVLYKGKYNVYANVDNLKNAGFEVSAKFLQHATIVKSAEKAENE